MKLSGKVFYWSARILSLGFVVFLSIFALDVFSQNSGFEIILPLFIHLLPSLILLTAIAIAWKYELFGAIIFFGFAIFYVWNVGLAKPLSWYLLIALPSSIVGVLYLASWLQKRKFKGPMD